MILPNAVANQQQGNATIEQVAHQLPDAVVHVRFDIAPDWSGDWGMFFRIILSDEAIKGGNVRAVTARVERMLLERLDFQSMGVIPYFNYRSQSEQAAMREPAWA
jgi:hypothetical protein